MKITINNPVRRLELLENNHYYFVAMKNVIVKEGTVRDFPEKIKEKAN
jgi:hypothetical protein